MRELGEIVPGLLQRLQFDLRAVARAKPAVAVAHQAGIPISALFKQVNGLVLLVLAQIPQDGNRLPEIRCRKVSAVRASILTEQLECVCLACRFQIPDQSIVLVRHQGVNFHSVDCHLQWVAWGLRAGPAHRKQTEDKTGEKDEDA
jgi:hypothetical protein